jgi:monoamine oxidase
LARAGTRILDDKDYLDPDERKRAAAEKRRELRERRLVPDWFGSANLRLPHDFRVAVIGAGFAGLAAGWYLRECGARVTLYEASSRIGGRVRTDRAFISGKIVEEGAELIGENHPLWWILAERFGLKLVELTGDEAYENAGLHVQTRFCGVDLTPQQKMELQNSLKGPLARIGKRALTIDETKPWDSVDALTLDKESVAVLLDREIGPTSVFARPWLKFALANDNCAAVDNQSSLGLLAAVSAARMRDPKAKDPKDPRFMLGYWMSTETHRCAGGNDLLADRLLRGVTDCRLNTAANLIRIRLPTDRGASMLERLGRRIMAVEVTSVECDSSGAVVKRRSDVFDFAVLAAPPSVWGTIKFDPTFDLALKTIQHGKAVKFLSRYATKSWELAKLIPPNTSGPRAPTAKWDELGSVWEGTDNQGDHPEFDLTVFSGGPYVLPGGAYPQRMSVLYPAMRPKAERFVDWPAARFIQTGYAVPGLRQVTTVSKNQIVPHEQRLFFAGEQTSPGFFGYMEGALQSGARAARDIVLCVARPSSVNGL